MLPNKKLSWPAYYRNRLNARYEWHIRTRYKYMINRIAREMGDFSVVLEAGAGIGSITKQLIRFDNTKRYMLLDNSNDMIELSRRNLTEEVKSVTINHILHDIRYPIGLHEKVLIHSHGVLEHFSDDDINNILKHQINSSELIFHYVPSDKYQYQSFGDERLMSPAEWSDICRPDAIEEFNDGYDLLLVWDRR